MKKILIAMAIMTICATAQAQSLPAIPEPEFIGEAVIVDLTTGQSRKIPKERGMIRNANFMGYITKKIVMKSKISPLEISDNINCAVIIKAENNLYDPISLFQLFRFEQNIDNQRVAELGSVNSSTYYAEGNSNTKKYVDFIAKKYGESSYILTFPISAGNYGIITGSLDEESIIVATFDVFDSAARAEQEAKRLAEEQAKMERKKKQEERRLKRSSNATAQ